MLRLTSVPSGRRYQVGEFGLANGLGRQTIHPNDDIADPNTRGSSWTIWEDSNHMEAGSIGLDGLESGLPKAAERSNQSSSRE